MAQPAVVWDLRAFVYRCRSASIAFAWDDHPFLRRRAAGAAPCDNKGETTLPEKSKPSRRHEARESIPPQVIWCCSPFFILLVLARLILAGLPHAA